VISYRVAPADLHAHLFAVTLSISRARAHQRVALPVWIPGSYMVREFSKHLQSLSAWQGKKRVALTQLDKCSWQIDCAAGAAIELRYEVYAFDNSVRTAFLDAQRGFFNPSSMCLRVLGHEAADHVLELVATKSVAAWAVATGAESLKVKKSGWGSYRAAGYDALVDTPFELGTFWSGEFTAAGVTHRFVVAGAAPSFDGERLLADARKICETAIDFWHGPRAGKRASKAPFDRYVFLLNAVHDGYGGLEHGNSTALICNRKDLPRRGSERQSEGYTTLKGLISHEYFHAWNVKRLRPVDFTRYQYEGEQYTRLLWFFEGFTSYYDDLLLRRAGLLDDSAYLKLLNKSINQALQTPGRLIQSVAEASFDAWIKYYRSDENTPNATVSYYTKGALVALCFDLSLRQASSSGRSLDDAMRALWRRCRGGPMAEADFLAVLEELSGRSFAPELAAWVHGTTELPLKSLLEAQGVRVHEDPAQMAHRLGLRVSETAGSVQVKVVLRGGAAEQAGFAAGDEWLAVNGWRIGSLDDLSLHALEHGPQVKRKPLPLEALVARDRRLLTLRLAPPPALTTWRLAVQDAKQVGAWLGT